MNKDVLPQGNHYHTSLLLTTHCNEDCMLEDAYKPERKHLKGAFPFEFSLVNLAVYVPDVLRSDEGHACMTLFKCGAPTMSQ